MQNIIYIKKLIFGILLHVAVKMENMKETKTVPTNFNEECNTKFLYFH